MAPQDEKRGIRDIPGLVSILWYARTLILYIVVLGTLVSVVVSFVMPEYFLSTTILLPETEKGKLASLGGLSDLAALAGVAAGDASLPKLYPIIIKSEAVLKDVIYHRYVTQGFKSPVNLIEFWDIEEKMPERSYEVALKKLRDDLNISIDPRTNVVTLSIETTEANLSADILNMINQELDSFIRTKRTTNASEQRKWIEGRLAEVKRELERSEDTLKTFRERNRQVTSSPELMMMQERLLRNVQINSTLFVELKKQYELAKIEEIKNIPIINIMDPARPAAVKSRPKKRVVVLIGFMLSMVVAGGFVLLRYQYGMEIENVVKKLKSQSL